MKKLLLSLLMIVGYASIASADEAVFDFVNNYDDKFEGTRSANNAPYTSNFSVIEEGVQLDFTSSNGFRLWSDGCRIYKGKNAKMKVTAPGNITKIEIKAKNGADFTYFIIDDVLTGTWDKGVYTAAESNPISEITFVYNDAGTYPISKITVTYTPNGLEAAGLQFSNSEYTALLGQDNEFPKLYNLAVSYSSSDEKVATVAADGSISLVDAGTTTITARYEGGDEFAAGSASYTLTVVKAASNLAEFIALVPEKDNTAYMAGDVQVVYVNGANVYVKDESASSLIYQFNLGYKAGDIIPGGWTGKNGVFNGLFEIVPVGSMPAATEGEAPEFPAYTGEVSLDMVNTVVTLKNVKFDSATAATKTSFTGTMGEQTLTFYNTFTIASVDAGTYDVQAVISRYLDNLQVSPIAYIPAAQDPTVVETTIYTGTLNIVIAGDTDNATELSDTDVKLFTMSDGTYTLLLENFGGDSETEGMGDIKVSDITRNGNEITGHADKIELGTIQASADLTGTIDNEDITIYISVKWQFDGNDIPIDVTFTGKKSSNGAIEYIGTDNDNAPVEYFNLQGIRVNADQLIPGIYVVRQGNKTSKVLVR